MTNRDITVKFVSEEMFDSLKRDERFVVLDLNYIFGCIYQHNLVDVRERKEIRTVRTVRKE